MPIGLTNASTTFMDRMNIVFREYLDKFIIIVIDGILIYLTNPEEHKEHLKVAQQTLKQNKI